MYIRITFAFYFGSQSADKNEPKKKNLLFMLNNWPTGMGSLLLPKLYLNFSYVGIYIITIFPLIYAHTLYAWYACILAWSFITYIIIYLR